MSVTNYTIDELFNRRELSVRAYNVCKFHDLLTAFDICKYYNEGYSFKALKNSGQKTVTELMGIVEKYDAQQVDEQQEIIGSLTEGQESALKIEYERILSTMSVRANNVLKNAGYNYRAIVQLINSSRENILNLQSCGEKTYNEIIDGFRPYKDFIDRVSAYDEKQIEYLEISNAFPFLTDDEKNFVQVFSGRNGYYPMFYISMKYFARTKNRNEKIFVAFKGIGCKANREIGKDYNLVFERTRQISIHTIGDLRTKPLFNIELWKQYEFLNRDYIISNTLLPAVNKSEFITDEYIDDKSFASIIEILTEYQRIEHFGYGMFFSPKLSSSFDIRESLKDLKKTVQARCTKETAIPITTFIDTYWKSSNHIVSDFIKNCLTDICQTVFSVEVDNQYNCLIKQNAIDVKAEVYKIIETNGQPMHLEEIFSAFKEKYPNHKYTQPKEIRAHLINAENITPLGKTSTYAIDKWNISSQSIRDLSYDILCNSNRPLTLEELVLCIQNKSRTTSDNSLRTVLFDGTGTFVKFKGGYIGVSNKNYSDEYEIAPLESRLRLSFEERLQDWTSFIDTYHYSPQIGGTEEEQSLNRWYNNVLKGSITLTEEQKQLFDTETRKREKYFYSGIEYNFMKKCDEYKLYVNKYCEMPKVKDEPQLYSWFRNNYSLYSEFPDKRKLMFEDLLKFLEDYGYTFGE